MTDYTDDNTPLPRKTQEKLLGYMKADYEEQMELVAAMTRDAQMMLMNAYIRADKTPISWFQRWRMKWGALLAVKLLWEHAEVADKLRKRFNDELDSVPYDIDVSSLN